MRVLVTGAAGFIGFHLALALAKEGYFVLGLDSINDYYDANLKLARLKELGIDDSKAQLWGQRVKSKSYENLEFIRMDLCDEDGIRSLFSEFKPKIVVNLAAQAGVRYSLEHPQSYIKSNIEGFCNILEGCRHHGVENLVYASSSSVYGLNKNLPFSEAKSTEHPISLYAASKKANEMMAHSYSHLFNLPATGLRFFTVYGPWGRPDMALFKFAKAAFENTSIDVYNHGDMQRDFTYIDDIIAGIMLCIKNPAKPSSEFDPTNPRSDISSAPYRIYNIGRSKPAKLLEYIAAIERELGKEIKKNMLPMQAGDVAATHADTSALELLGYKPKISIDEGVAKFIAWYKSYFKLKAQG